MTEPRTAHESLIILRLDRIETTLDEMRDQLVLTRIEVAMLKVKSGVWGAAAGLIPALLVIGVTALNGG